MFSIKLKHYFSNSLMKTGILLLCLISFLLITTSCANDTEKYPFDYIGLYDVHAKQKINVFDDKAKIEKILGEPNKTSNYDTFTVYYYDDLSIRYDKDNKISSILYSPFLSDDGLTYELPGNITMNSSVTDFINQYHNVYEIKEDFFVRPWVGIFVEKINNNFIVLSKKDLKEYSDSLKNSIDIESQEKHEVYVICLDYLSYSEISKFEIYKRNIYSFDNWDEILTELDTK